MGLTRITIEHITILSLTHVAIVEEILCNIYRILWNKFEAYNCVIKPWFNVDRTVIEYLSYRIFFYAMVFQIIENYIPICGIKRNSINIMIIWEKSKL